MKSLFRKTIVAGLAALLLGTAGGLSASLPDASAAALKNGETIELWPGKAPGSEHVAFHNTIKERSKDPAQHDRIMVNIDKPSMVAYVPKNPNGTALIVAPGGGYARVVLDKEGTEVADWLGPKGVTVFILRYRLPGDPHKNKADVSLEDSQRAVRLVREHAAEWNIDPQKIGIMGFSAGGHLATSLSTCFDRKVYQPVDAADQLSARPNYSIRGYPVVSMLPEYASKGTKKRMLGEAPSQKLMEKYSPELHVTENTPPAFLVCAADDNVVPPINSIRYFEALRAHGVQAELHIYREGGHGFGLGHKLTTSTKDWTQTCEGWLRDMGRIE